MCTLLVNIFMIQLDLKSVTATLLFGGENSLAPDSRVGSPECRPPKRSHSEFLRAKSRVGAHKTTLEDYIYLASLHDSFYRRALVTFHAHALSAFC